jgi:glutaredoxin
MIARIAKVPNIFIGGKHLGGNDELMKARSSGKLKVRWLEY